jgi:hypothetical protein
LTLQRYFMRNFMFKIVAKSSAWLQKVNFHFVGSLELFHNHEASVKTWDFWGLTSRSLMEVYVLLPSFSVSMNATQRKKILKMEAVSSSEKSVNFYQTKCRNISENCALYGHWNDNLKSNTGPDLWPMQYLISA